MPHTARWGTGIKHNGTRRRVKRNPGSSTSPTALPEHQEQFSPRSPLLLDFSPGQWPWLHMLIWGTVSNADKFLVKSLQCFVCRKKSGFTWVSPLDSRGAGCCLQQDLCPHPANTHTHTHYFKCVCFATKSGSFPTGKIKHKLQGSRTKTWEATKAFSYFRKSSTALQIHHY